MSSSTPNIGLTLPTGGERVSRQIINENNTKIDTYAGELSEQIGTLNTSLTQHSIYASSKLDVYTLAPHMGVLYFTGLEITGETNIADVIPSGYRSTGLQRCGVICDNNGDSTCLVTILGNGTLNLAPNTNNTKTFYGTVLFRY